jgi:hypothetical protein
LYGKRSGQRIGIGDVLTVQVVSADPEAGQVDFQLAGQPVAREDEHGFERRPAKREGRRGQDRFDRSPRRKEKEREREKDSRFQSREKPRKSAQPQPTKFEKSKKAQAMDKMEERVFEFLNEANTESQNKGETFDPEKHFQQALKKWRARMGEPEAESKPSYKQFGKDSKPQGGRKSSHDRSGGGRSSNTGRSSEGRSGEDRPDGGRSGGGGKKKSSHRGKRR